MAQPQSTTGNYVEHLLDNSSKIKDAPAQLPSFIHVVIYLHSVEERQSYAVNLPRIKTGQFRRALAPACEL